MAIGEKILLPVIAGEHSMQQVVIIENTRTQLCSHLYKNDE